ncbi:MAG: L,D-transpeptidase family protein [Gammaproteobacteria bacterium]|nr:L,D-transpeptidase family protein [Gammaproteobacteria bacterium]
MIAKHFKLLSTASFIILLSSCAKTPSVSHGTSLPMVSPPNTTNKTAMRIYETLPVYANAAKITWAPIVTKTPIKVGSDNAYIPVIHQRLIALQDLPPEVAMSKDTTFTHALAHGVAQFQSENDLKPTGIINQETLNALNITPTTRHNELLRSMNQWARLPEDANSRYIQVNIPQYEMHLQQGREAALRMKVVIGRASRPTPELSSTITTIVFNPSWNIPKTILAQDVIPGMQKNPNYMNEHYDMKVYANWSKDAPEISPAAINWQTADISNFTYRVTAPPSDKNPLGRVKFIFANDQDVYMHDTPEKGLFALNDRARSSGCIRLENPMALVEYFYSDNTDLNQELVNQYLSTYETKYIQLKNPMPVYITYITSWVDQNGHAHFANDIYKSSGV